MHELRKLSNEALQELRLGQRLGVRALVVVDHLEQLGDLDDHVGAVRGERVGGPLERRQAAQMRVQLLPQGLQQCAGVRFQHGFARLGVCFCFCFGASRHLPLLVTAIAILLREIFRHLLGLCVVLLSWANMQCD